jgi:uroporphyrinogen decarboxylase
VTSKQRVLASLRLEKPDRVPFMEWWIDNGIGARILGLPPGTPFDRGDLAMTLGMDGVGAYVIPDRFGIYASGENGRQFPVDGQIRTRDDLAKVKPRDPDDASLYDVVRRTVDRWGDRLAVFGGSLVGIDPLVTCLGLERFAYAIYDDLPLVEALLDIYAEWAQRAAVQLQRCGVDMIWYADDFAFTNGLLFSPQFFREVIVPRMRKVFSAVRVPILYHTDGDPTAVLDDLAGLGVSAFHPVDPSALDIVDVKRRFGRRLCLVGNIDIRKTLVSATTGEVRAEVLERIRTIGADGGYIVSSANSITDYCRLENVLAMRDAVLGQVPAEGRPRA